jgi:hypothetical protein
MKKIMMEGTFKQMYFSFGSIELIKLKDFCFRKNYKVDEVISLLCTSFNGDIDLNFVRKNYPELELRCKMFKDLGEDWRLKGG